MDAYRDQYATLFNNGDGVKVFAISIDADTALHSWARDKGYPITFLSDTGAAVGKLYGAAINHPRAGWLDARVLFVIDPKGRISKVMSPFRETDPTAYTELAEAVAAARAAK